MGTHKKELALFFNLSLIKSQRDSEQGPATGKGTEPAGAENKQFLIEFEIKTNGIQSVPRGPAAWGGGVFYVIVCLCSSFLFISKIIIIILL